MSKNKIIIPKWQTCDRVPFWVWKDLSVITDWTLLCDNPNYGDDFFKQCLKYPKIKEKLSLEKLKNNPSITKGFIKDFEVLP